MEFENDKQEDRDFLTQQQEAIETLQQQNQQMLAVIKSKNVNNLFCPDMQIIRNYSTIGDKNTAAFMTGEQYGNISMYNRYLKFIIEQIGAEKDNFTPLSAQPSQNSEDVQTIINKALGLK